VSDVRTKEGIQYRLIKIKNKKALLEAVLRLSLAVLIVFAVIFPLTGRLEAFFVDKKSIKSFVAFVEGVNAI